MHIQQLAFEHCWLGDLLWFIWFWLHLACDLPASAGPAVGERPECFRLGLADIWIGRSSFHSLCFFWIENGQPFASVGRISFLDGNRRVAAGRLAYHRQHFHCRHSGGRNFYGGHNDCHARG